jgi:hypothetical protein
MPGFQKYLGLKLLFGIVTETGNGKTGRRQRRGMVEQRKGEKLSGESN